MVKRQSILRELGIRNLYHNCFIQICIQGINQFRVIFNNGIQSFSFGRGSLRSSFGLQPVILFNFFLNHTKKKYNLKFI